MYIDLIAEKVEHLRRWIEEHSMYTNIGILIIQLRCYMINVIYVFSVLCHSIAEEVEYLEAE